MASRHDSANEPIRRRRSKQAIAPRLPSVSASSASRWCPCPPVSARKNSPSPPVNAACAKPFTLRLAKLSAAFDSRSASRCSNESSSAVASVGADVVGPEPVSSLQRRYARHENAQQSADSEPAPSWISKRPQNGSL